MPGNAMEFMTRLIEKVRSFMIGRYGNDRLNNLFLMLALVLMFFGILFQISGIWIVALLLFLGQAAFTALFVYRILSKKIYVRMAENNKYLKLRGKITGFFNLRKAMFRDRKTHVFKKCPNCKSVLRLPRKKGHHTVKCIRCAHRFDVDVR
jgi:hypothetical protein